MLEPVFPLPPPREKPPLPPNDGLPPYRGLSPNDGLSAPPKDDLRGAEPAEEKPPLLKAGRALNDDLGAKEPSRGSLERLSLLGADGLFDLPPDGNLSKEPTFLTNFLYM